MIPPSSWGNWENGGLAKFADPSEITFQRLRFGGTRGFTLEGTTTVNFKDQGGHWAQGLRFSVLRPPAAIHYRGMGGGNETESIQIKEWPVHGGRVSAIIIQGTPVVPVIAADGETTAWFRKSKAIELLQFDHVQESNIDDIRWLRPDQITMVDTPQAREHAQEAERDRAQRERLDAELAEYEHALTRPTVFAIHGSVGENGKNDVEDVKRVSHRLHELGFLDNETLDVDAVSDAIYDYQYQVLHVKKLDARVDPGGATAAALKAGRKTAVAMAVSPT